MRAVGTGAGTGTVSWRELLAEAATRLGSATEARRIVERASGMEGAELHLGLDQPVTERTAAHFEAMLQRREAGEPLQYVLGSWGFRSLDLFVDRRVLIPRPETETVVGFALAELARLAPRPHPRVVDLGTGSGAIALSIATEVSGAEVWATERSPDALAVARANLAGTGMAGRNVRLAEGSWFAALPPMLRGQVHLIVSNPPYVGEREVPDLPPEVARWEPRSALVAGPTGLEQVEAIVEEAPRWLTRPGSLVVEIAPHQAQAAIACALRSSFSAAEVKPDLAGRLRALVARL
ncbi:MAG TPA: peptide chain release factor N(5)-glutamine methyltransferase [Acidimicrobiales bacterium]|nr:peptide chain release factor N(5)-glutamine methyltransferase [Acidimicrobiales bacterium]